MFQPLLPVDVAVPVCAKLRREMEPVNVDVPAPVTASDGVVSVPFAAIEVVPVEPNAAVLARELPENEVVDVAYVVVEFVVVNPPLKARAVVVALPGNGYAKFA